MKFPEKTGMVRQVGEVDELQYEGGIQLVATQGSVQMCWDLNEMMWQTVVGEGKILSIL